jgi:drug/metabolite transporter (DMT)-like permease
MLQQQSPPSVMPIVFIAAIVGSVIDWRYQKRGGKQPTGKERLLFIGGIVACGVLLVVFGLQGARAEWLGGMTATLVSILFSVWEFHRWRVRRRHPLPVKLKLD